MLSISRKVAVLLLLFAAASPTTRAAKVTRVELSHEAGYTIARIHVADGTVRFTHQTEIAKDGRPYRTIVDVLSAVHDLGQKNFSFLPNCAVKGIRSSQYSVKPEQVVRLVFDMTGETPYQIKSSVNSITIKFSDSGNKPFASWSSVKVVQQAKARDNKPQSSAKAEVKVAAVAKTTSQKTVAQKNSAIEKDRTLSLQSIDAKPKMAQADDKSAPASKVKIKPAVSASQLSATKPKVTPPSSTTKKRGIPYGPDVNWAAAEPDATPARKPSISKPKSAIAKTTVEKKSTAKGAVIETKLEQKAKPDRTLGSIKTASTNKMTPLTKAAVSPKPQQKAKVTVAKKPAVSKPANLETKKSVLTKAEKSAKALAARATEQSKKAVSIKKKVVASASIKPSNKKSNEKPIIAAKPAKKSETRSTARFRRDAAQERKIKGTLVAEFPKRLVVKYKARSRRDPFETLINDARTYNSPVEVRVPNVEGLKLVGVIESAGEKNSALFEDKDGYGYILKAGDKIKKGYVLRVDSKRVYFQIFEYGWSRTMAMGLEDY